MTTMQDPANYRKMSEPFPSSEAANEAIETFFQMVREARNTCKIQDVHILIKFPLMVEGEEKIAINSGHLGNSGEGLMMCAWGIKQELAEQQTTIKELLGE